MLADFVITFRETLEAALIIGIILAYLVKTNRVKYNNIVYMGIAAAIAASLAGAYAFNALAGGFEGRAEEIFEGISMLFAAVLITFMIVWMMKQKHIAEHLHKKVDEKLSKQQKAGLFFLTFIAVVREGIETVIFLGAASFVSQENNALGAILGIVVAVGLGYLIFVAGKKVNMRAFFNATSVLLILFAAGLTAHGVHELNEVGIVPEIVEHVWDTNWLVNEEAVFGSFLASLIGYNGNPSLTEVIAYLAYLGMVFILYKIINGKQKIKAEG
jgi:high-affinity iron transporter